jgi:hypothetical protein
MGLAYNLGKRLVDLLTPALAENSLDTGAQHPDVGLDLHFLSFLPRKSKNKALGALPPVCSIEDQELDKN